MAAETVVITGMGLVSPIGYSVGEFEESLFSGVSGVKSIRNHLVSENFPVPYAAFLDRDRVSLQTPLDAKRYTFVGVAAAAAAEQALEQGIAIDAVLFGTADGIGYDVIRETFMNYPDIDVELARGERPLEAIAQVMKGLGIAYDERQLISINGACSSGNQAIGMAMQRVRSGEWTRALVGGVDARCSPTNLMNFHMLGALCTDDVEPSKASRPFAKDRSGFIRGEGAACLVIERLSTARARGAKILATVEGYANTTDANRLTDGRDDALCVKKAIAWAVEDAGLTLDQIDAVSAHGTSTQLNDRLETKAIKEVFGERAYRIPVTSLKSQIGHSTVAAGALEAVSVVLMLERQRLSPTLNYQISDPECDLDYVPLHSREAKLNHILSNNFAFGGQNACLVFGREPTA